MVSMTASVCIDAEPVAVWEQLARLEDIARWAPGIRSARCPDGRSWGVGAERICDLSGGVTLTERWIQWDEGRSFTYEGSGLPGVRLARNTWSVEPAAPGRTLLRSQAEVELRSRPVGRLAGPLIRLQSRRLSRRSLAAFKQLVEGGSASHSRRRFQRFPATC